MNKPIRKEITLLQYILGINAAQIGTSILTLPSILAKKAETGTRLPCKPPVIRL